MLVAITCSSLNFQVIFRSELAHLLGGVPGWTTSVLESGGWEARVCFLQIVGNILRFFRISYAYCAVGFPFRIARYLE